MVVDNDYLDGKVCIRPFLRVLIGVQYIFHRRTVVAPHMASRSHDINVRCRVYARVFLGSFWLFSRFVSCLGNSRI